MNGRFVRSAYRLSLYVKPNKLHRDEQVYPLVTAPQHSTRWQPIIQTTWTRRWASPHRARLGRQCLRFAPDWEVRDASVIRSLQ